MAAPKAGQGGSSLSGIITLTALFLVAAVAAVVFYLKAENCRTQAQTAGDREKRAQTSMRDMKTSLDEMTRLSIGQVPDDTSAEDRLKAVKDKFQTLLTNLGSEVEAFKGASAESESMLSVLDRMKDTTNAAKAAELASQQKIVELSAENETLRKATLEKEEHYGQTVQKFAADANTTQSNFSALQSQMDQNAKDMIAMVEAKLAASEETARNLQKELNETRSQLDIAKQRLSLAEAQLSKILPPPDSEAPAFRPDGQIISIDNKAGLVYINLGTADRVYRGLTFTVYDKGIPIPRDGKGKAEIEVLEPKERMSIARIAVANPKKPVLVDDIVANLVWENDRSWVFVVAGDFDLNRDGSPDVDGVEKVKALIMSWGGKVAKEISPSTDFVVIGAEPVVPYKPTGEEVMTNPAAMNKYETALAAQEAYKSVLAQAQSLSLPIFSLERLLYMTGYEAMSPKGSVLAGGSQ